jgi:uncharacterized protein
MHDAQPAQGIHLMAKPAGPLCNLDCSYCFYLEKAPLLGSERSFRMDDATLEAYVQGYIASQPTPEVEFTWQGGEPTLMGVPFFERAVALQRRYAAGKTIRNTLQTNGTLIDEAWCAFLAREGFTVGLSLDGPEAVHGLYRKDRAGASSFAATVRGLDLLLAHGVAVNVLVTVARDVAKHPVRIYTFLKGKGVRFIQFNPVVERAVRPGESLRGQWFAQPPALSKARPTTLEGPDVTALSVEPEAYGDFLIAVFDAWIRRDVGQIHVMNFEWALAAWCQLPSTVCIFSRRCGKAAVVEHDGSVYSCDHFVYPEYWLGSLREASPAALLASPAQQAFGAAKETTLPGECLRCEYRFACHGECPKNRFAITKDGEPGLNYLCPGYKKYFKHITQYMNGMAKLVAHGQPAADIMRAFQGPLVVSLAKTPR